MNNFYKFGEFRLDGEKKILWRANAIVSLSPKAIEVLVCLVESRGDLLTRDYLLERVWHDTFVEEGNITQAIHALRKVLGDDAVQTIPKRGYRFAAEIIEKAPWPTEELILARRSISETVIDEQEISEAGEAHFIDESPSLPWTRRPSVRITAVFAVILILAFGFWAFSTRFGSSSGKNSIRSIAVLPLKAFSQGSTNEEMRLQITDALITKLGGLNKIIVRPTNSVLRYSGEGRDVVEAGRELAVDAVLEGRIQVENDRLRVTLQLISVADGEQLWSEQFDGKVGEILALQDLISSRLRRDFAFVEVENPNHKRPVNDESYEAYLKGRYLWNLRTKDSYFKALEYFQRSVEADPKFALGYTGIADSYHLLQQRNVLGTDEAYAKAEEACRKALELDPLLPEAHTSMGSVSFIRYSRWTEAEAYYTRAIELDPNLPEPYARLGMLYNAWGRFDEAHITLTRAEELDPTSLNNAIYMGACFYFSKQYDQAIVQFKRILEFAPQTERAHFFLTRIYELNGRYDEAVAHALKEREVFRPDSVEPLRKAYETGGIRSFWSKQIEFLKEESANMHGLENHIASRYALLGDFDNSCLFVEKNLLVRGTMKNYGRVDPLFDSLRSNPRFQELMKKADPDI